MVNNPLWCYRRRMSVCVWQGTPRNLMESLLSPLHTALPPAWQAIGYPGSIHSVSHCPSQGPMRAGDKKKAKGLWDLDKMTGKERRWKKNVLYHLIMFDRRSFLSPANEFTSLKDFTQSGVGIILRQLPLQNPSACFFSLLTFWCHQKSHIGMSWAGRKWLCRVVTSMSTGFSLPWFSVVKLLYLEAPISLSQNRNSHTCILGQGSYKKNWAQCHWKHATNVE